MDDGFVYLAPTCCQLVKNYGSNSMEGVMYYHHFTGCDLEKVVFGQPCHPQYEEREVAFALTWRRASPNRCATSVSLSGASEN